MSDLGDRPLVVVNKIPGVGFKIMAKGTVPFFLKSGDKLVITYRVTDDDIEPVYDEFQFPEAPL